MFKSFFKNKAIEDESILKDEKTLSIACLLVEAAMVDESFGEDEKKVISKILMKNFDIVDEKNLKGKMKQAFSNGFLGIPSFGYSTFIRDNRGCKFTAIFV